MKAEIITIGDEILIGQVVDTNSSYIASRLNQTGFKVSRITSVSDTHEAIVSALDQSIPQASLVILTGGLGPTADDITKKCLRDYFGGEFVADQYAMSFVKELCRKRGIPLSERNTFQAMVPDSCQTLNNHSGSAPGMLFRKDNCIIASMPGVPFEMKDILDNELIPLLREELQLPVRMHKTILTCGIPESIAADMLTDYEKKLPDQAGFAYLPSPGMLRLRISISGENKDYLNEKLKELVQQAKTILGQEHVFGFDEDTLPGVVEQLLVENGLHIAIAESCTGGNIAKMLTAVPGSSACLKGSVTAYANETKQKVLGVSAENLKKFGAVSQEVVQQMATGIRELMNADFSIATSGIAGPGGGSVDKPVGTVWIAVATPDGVFTQKHLFGDNRERNITRASVTALNTARNMIIEYLENSK